MPDQPAVPANSAFPADAGRSPKLVFLITEDWFFLSHFLDRALAAREAGYDVIVAARDNGNRARIEGHGLRFVEIPFRRRTLHPGDEVRALLAIRRLLRAERPAIVHQVAMKPIVYGSMIRSPAARLNALAGLGYVFTSTDLAARVLRPLLKGALRVALNRGRSLTVFENGDDLAACTGGGLTSPERARLLKGAGVDLAHFRPAPEPAGAFTVVFVGRMLRDKGVREFVEAARILRSHGRDFRLVLVGAPDLENPSSVAPTDLQRWTAEGVVDWLGHRRDIAAILAASHLAVLPSYREGLPKSLLEAMAAQRAVVATDVPGCRDLVTHEENGLLVPARDSVALAEAISRLADAPALRRRLALAGRQLVCDEYSAARIANETLRIYRELLGAAAPSGSVAGPLGDRPPE